MLAAGIAVGLGTDGAASNNDLDMFEAMRQAAFLHKLVTERSARGAGARRRSRWRRIGGARALGMERPNWLARGGQARRPRSSCGTDAPRQTPMYDPVSHLVYAAHGDDVRTTIVNGRVLMRDRQVLTLDEAARAGGGADAAEVGPGGREQ